MPTVLIISKQETDETSVNGQDLLGYRVDITVDVAASISDKIFVMQREVISGGDEGEYEDQFYSVASVPQLESVPENPTESIPFYRTNSISLIFATPEDRDTYTDLILSMVEKLRIANDISNTMIPSTVIGYPPKAVARFWGVTQETTISDEILLAGTWDSVYSKELSKTIVTPAELTYAYIAVRDSLGAITEISVNGNPVTTVLVSRNVEVVDGTEIAYRIYRTENTVPQSSTILLESV